MSGARSIVGRTLTFSSSVPPVKGNDVWMGVDPSLTGFAISVIDEKDNFEANVFRSSGKGVVRLSDIFDFVNEQMVIWTPKDVAMEGTVLRSSSASVLGELSGVVKLALYYKGFFPVLVPPTTLKKFVTGDGSAPKNRMMMMAFKRYGVDIPDDNAVDAYGLSRISRGVGLVKTEKDIINKVSGNRYREED